MSTHARRSFAQRLSSLRRVVGYEDAKDFAEALGIQPNTYRRWERAETEPSIELILRICQRLGVTPTFLLLGHTQESANLMAAPPPDPKTVRKPPRRVSHKRNTK